MDVNLKLTDKGLRDYQLIQRALNQGDQQAYASLLNNYRDAVYFMMLKMTSNAFEAEDLTIEAFGKAFRSLNQYSPEYGFSTWLFRIAANNCIDFQRRNKFSSVSLNAFRYSPESTTKQFTDPELNPEQMLIYEQKVKTMRQVVERLKPHYRGLVKMRYFEEKSYEEIACQLNLPLGTVKAQLFRAREFLFEILKKSIDKI